MSLDWNINNGEELRKIRLKQGLSKADFCKRFRLSTHLLEDIELGLKEPCSEIITFMYGVSKIEKEKIKPKYRKSQKVTNVNNVCKTPINKVVKDTNISTKVDEKKAIIVRNDKCEDTNGIQISLLKEQDIYEKEREFIPKNKTQMVCGVNIPENVVDYLKEAIALKKLNHIYELRILNKEAITAVKADIEILISQREKILKIPYEKWGMVLNHCVDKGSNWFCYGAMLKMFTDNINSTFNIEGAYGGVTLTATAMFYKEKKEAIANMPSLLDFIYNHSKKYDFNDKYIKYSDKDIFLLLKDISNKKESISFNIYKEKNGDKDCVLKLQYIKEGYIVEVYCEGKITKYFYNSLNE